jgi:alkaline phosphatase
MTAKAIELLSQDSNGFFLMVESSQVDWGGHNNDPIYMVRDFIEFDNAAKVARDFAEADGSTLVVGFPDHDCGGMEIGNRDYNGAYTHLTVEELIDPLKGMQVSSGALAGEIGDMPGGITVDNIKAKTLELWDIDVSDEVAQEVIDLAGAQEGQDGYTISFSYALARVMSKHYTAIGWTSHGHNGEDVPVWAYGPCAPEGMLANTDMADVVADAFGINLLAENLRLFVDLDYLVTDWTLDETDPSNPVARLEGARATAELPCSKDLLTITTTAGATRTYNLEGVVVHAPATSRVYVPRQAVRIMRWFGIW